MFENYNIISTHVINYCPEINIDRKIIINMNYMDQDSYSGLHRCGWSYVIKGLQYLDTLNNNNKPANILVDTCIDRTFMWGLNVMKLVKIIPYTTPWVGFIHHTFYDNGNIYNCHTLLNNPEFIESLKYCKCLITLSLYLKQQLEIELKLKNIHVNIVNMIHPTEIVDNEFTMSKFKSNNMKKVIQIGEWLRNIYSIYTLQLPENNILNIRKAILNGRKIENFFEPSSILSEFTNLDHHQHHHSICTPIDYHQHHHSICTPIDYHQHHHSICTPIDHHHHHSICTPIDHHSICIPIDDLSSNNEDKIIDEITHEIIEYLDHNNNSVEIIEYLNNYDYDKLLSKNIVFLNLYDVSVNNTVIECIVRNTPIIINRHPALVELLGDNYPGFYSNSYDAISKIIDIDKIEEIHLYLKRLDKTPFTLTHFIHDFQSKIYDLI